MNAGSDASAKDSQNPAYSTLKSALNCLNHFTFTLFVLTARRNRLALSVLNFQSFMANKKSALKYIRKTEGRTLRNRQVKSRLKTLSKKVDAAAQQGDQEKLRASVRQFISALDKACKNNLVHPNKVARHKSRCAQLPAA